MRWFCGVSILFQIARSHCFLSIICSAAALHRQQHENSKGSCSFVIDEDNDAYVIFLEN